MMILLMEITRTSCIIFNTTNDIHLVDEIDEKYIEERQRTKENLLRYKGISNALINAEKNRLRREGGGEEGSAGDVQSGFDATSLFGSAVSKVFSAGKSKVSTTITQPGSSIGGGTKGSSLYASSTTESNSYAGAAEEGMYNDEEKEFDWCAGDYNARCADDEEDNVVFEQANLDELEALEMSSSIRHDAEGEDAADDDTEDEEEDVVDAGDDGEEEDGVGLVDKSMVTSATEVRKIYEVIQGFGINQPIGGSTGVNAAVPTSDSKVPPVIKSALKRPRDETEQDLSAITKMEEAEISAITSSNSVHNRVTFSSSITSGADIGEVKASVQSLVKAAGSQQTSSIDYPLTETGIRLFIANRGGKATIKELEVDVCVCVCVCVCLCVCVSKLATTRAVAQAISKLVRSTTMIKKVHRT